MAQREDQVEKDSTKGFAGLSSMVSDVDSAVAQTARDSPATTTAPPRPPLAASPRAPKSEESGRPPYQAPAQPSGKSSAGKWLLGIAAAVGLFWLVSQSGNKSSSPVYRSSSDSSSAASPNPTWQAAPSPSLVPTRPPEETPPGGSNNVLTSAQLRYCIAEDIRLEAAKGVINNFNDAHVERFNAMASDYNSRCGQFRYRSGSLEAARADVESYRTSLEADGRARFAEAKSASSRGLTVASEEPIPHPTVMAVQEGLTKLGYDVGPVNGLAGTRTRSAIVAFQTANKITATGLADKSLLLQVDQALSAARSVSSKVDGLPGGITPTEKTPNDAPPSGERRAGAPPNAWVSGSAWYCNEGYRKVGDSCEKLNVPANAWVSGSAWYCNEGYRKVGDSCEKLNVPANAWVSGSAWYCNEGYRKVGDSCEKLNVPANAWVSGSAWYCNEGYRKVGDKCESIFGSTK